MAAFYMLIVILFLLQPFSATSINWDNTNANGLGTNFVQQNGLSPHNSNNLSLAWSFPFPSSSPPAGLNFTGEGAIAPPLVVNGIVYVVMNDLHVVALRATDGATIWTYQPSLNRTGLPLGILAGHVHGLTYHNGNVWLSLPDCSALALNALTGIPVERMTKICLNIPGNGGVYDYSGAPLVFDGDILIWSASSVSEGTDAGRGFVAAYNISNMQLIWRWFVSPPKGGDPNWDRDSCRSPCHGNVPSFPGDWGILGATVNTTMAGAGPSWGQPVVDSLDSLLFLGTSQPSPDWNATFRPGPNLYSDSIIALSLKNGSLVWYYQTTPHDLYDFDCGWNVALGSIVRNGANQTVVFKECKNGYVYALGAKSGNLVWYFDPLSVARLNTPNANYVVDGTYNSTIAWTDSKTGTIEQCPGVNGGIEADISLAYGKVFVAAYNLCSYVMVGPVQKVGGAVTGASDVTYNAQQANTTIYAIDASSGKVVWSYFIPLIPFRGWLTSTGGMVFASTLDGQILAIDSSSGRVVGITRVGSPLYEGVTVGTDSEGNLRLFQLTSSPSYGGFSSSVPGALMAYTPLAQQSILPTIIAFATGGVAAATLIIAFVYLLVYRRRATNPLSWRTDSVVNYLGSAPERLSLESSNGFMFLSNPILC